MKLLSQGIWAEITAAAKAEATNALVAVAYFGERGDRLLPLRKGSTLVVDASLSTVASGGTCPAALLRLLSRGVAIFSAQNLHAKVFAFESIAFVGSPNASTNSQKYLLEAVIKIGEKKGISQARSFVTAIAITRLDANDLAQLMKHYRPPKHSRITSKQAATSTLVMELTKEQGIKRATQVQPPRPVWESYFGVNFDHGPYPTLTLLNQRTTPPNSEKRTVIKHHHNLTIEIADAEMPRPAIIEIRRVGSQRYAYLVHRPPSKTFTKHKKLLATVQNPLWTSGRRWQVF